MRVSRLRKFKSKYRGFWITAKIVTIWYLLLFSATYLTSNTAAIFSDSVEPTGEIQAGYWVEEEYNLEFDQSGNPHRGCIIDATIKNKGPGDMSESVEFDVYYIKNGNPENGDSVGKGEIDPLSSGESAEVRYEVTKSGTYAFIIDEDTLIKPLHATCDTEANQTNSSEAEMMEDDELQEETKDEIEGNESKEKNDKNEENDLSESKETETIESDEIESDETKEEKESEKDRDVETEDKVKQEKSKATKDNQEETKEGEEE